ncbi:hypothetical protein TSAR_004910 [Trichomalopsis sarcophagae]|uniref:Uncharacterized protein n=1 Tax=Trichomalopsis sarcophagae TaxID=543379 RepID=A0A232EQ12_9HYME|nr:hypothetical protein TSAR_004910 [Trichomalopsis sarcophagae]
MTSKTSVASTSPISRLATNVQSKMHIKTPSPTNSRVQRKIKRRLNQICNQMSEMKLSSPPQPQQLQEQQQQQQDQQEHNMDQEELERFCQASTVKKGSKRAIEEPESLAPRNILAESRLSPSARGRSFHAVSRTYSTHRAEKLTDSRH